MNDRLGAALRRWRTRTVLPYTRGRLLDVGCGSNELVRRHGNGVGVDVYQWGDVDLVVPDTAHLPYESESFDTATIVAALNHIPNREEVLREAWRLLRPGGRIVVTMIPPALSHAWHVARRRWDADQSERGMKEGEVWGLTRADVVRLLEEAGFVIHAQKRFMLGANLLTVAEKPAPATAGRAATGSANVPSPL